MSRSSKKNTKNATIEANVTATATAVTVKEEAAVAKETDAQAAAKAEMKKKIDKLLSIRRAIAALKEQDDELKADIHDFLEAQGAEIVRTEKAEVKMVKGSRRDVKPEDYYKALDNNIEKLLASVKVTIGDAERFVPKSKLTEISNVTAYSYVKVGSLKGDTKKIVYL